MNLIDYILSSLFIAGLVTAFITSNW